MRRTTVAEPDADDNGGAARMARCTDADENGGVAFTARCIDADYDARATNSGAPRRRQVRWWPRYGQKPHDKGV
jgi:hypothetical protein